MRPLKELSGVVFDVFEEREDQMNEIYTNLKNHDMNLDFEI